MKPLCLKCKGRGWCGGPCKYYKKYLDYKKVDKDFKKDFYGSSPSIFVGRHDYPKVNIGFLSPQYESRDAWKYDAPEYWSKNYKINQVINKRRRLVNSRGKNKVKDVDSNKVRKLQEIALSKEPVNIEVNLKKKPVLKIVNNFNITPSGPASNIKKLVVCDNPKIKRPVSKAHYDTDFKAEEAVTYLYNKGISENSIVRILSSGSVGVENNRKLVPTRWSITAVDDILGKYLIKKVRDYKIINDYMILYGKFYGNIYTIILLPSLWGYELFETTNGDEYCHDYEEYDGRKEYAYETAGGYYAARLAILEYLEKKKVQARAVLIREVTEEYYCPLGVWVVRQAARKACNEEKSFETINKMKKYLEVITPCHFLMNNSVLYEKFKTQKTLMNYV